MKKHIRKFTAAAVLSVMVIAAASSFMMNDSKVSFSENRRLADFPKLSASSVYNGRSTEEAEKYAADHLAMRDKMLSFRTKLTKKFGGGTVNDVYIGKDRLLDAEISQRPADQTLADRINTFARSYNGTLYIAVIPTSSGIYGEEMPAHLLKFPEGQQISSLYDSLDTDIRRIDAYNLLKMLKENYIYFRTDTKWTSYGAYCIYRTVIQKLGFLPVTYDMYTIRHVANNFRGSLYNRCLCTDTMADMLDIYEYPDGAQVQSCMAMDKNGISHEINFYDMDMLESSYMYNMYMGAPEAVVQIETDVNNQRKLLIIKDSYADCFIPFLTQHYSKITVISPQYLDGELSDYVDLSGYEQTLMLFGIENAGDTQLMNGLL